MKNLSIIALIFVGLVIGCKPPANNTAPANSAPANTASANTAPDEKPIAVAAKVLTKDYDDNELAADGKYKGKRLTVTGKVTSIAETLGKVTVQIEGHNLVVTVMCSVEDSERDAVAKLKKGELATVTGTGDGYTLGLYVGLSKCKLK